MTNFILFYLSLNAINTTSKNLKRFVFCILSVPLFTLNCPTVYDKTIVSSKSTWYTTTIYNKQFQWIKTLLLVPNKNYRYKLHINEHKGNNKIMFCYSLGKETWCKKSVQYGKGIYIYIQPENNLFSTFNQRWINV